jgi:hypothetical protein
MKLIIEFFNFLLSQALNARSSIVISIGEIFQFRGFVSSRIYLFHSIHLFRNHFLYFSYWFELIKSFSTSIYSSREYLIIPLSETLLQEQIVPVDVLLFRVSFVNSNKTFSSLFLLTFQLLAPF